MAYIVVTPSSRGIGAALTRHLLRTTPSSIPIIATTRSSDVEATRSALLDSLDFSGGGGSSSSSSSNNNSGETSRSTNHQKSKRKSTSRSELSDRLDVRYCDLLSETSIADFASYVKDRYHNNKNNNNSKRNRHPAGKMDARADEPPHLRVGFFLPGMLQPEKSPSQIDHDTALETFKLNVLAPMMLLKHFTPLLPKKSIQSLPAHDGTEGDGEETPPPVLPPTSIIACMSARVGSITDNRLGGWYSYRASKAGLNQVVRSVDIYARMQSGPNACVVGLHPGTVKTGLSREFWHSVSNGTTGGKLFTPEFAAERLWDVVLNKVGSDVETCRGRCWDWKGEEVPP